MLHQGYIVRMRTDLAAAVMRSINRQTEQRDPEGSARMLEAAVGEAVAMDGAAFLSLSPDSIASIMQVTATDPQVSEYVARTVMLASIYLDEAGDQDMASLRRSQALAIANAYGHDLSDMEAGAQAAEEATLSAMQDVLP